MAKHRAPNEHTAHYWLTWLPDKKRWVLTWSWSDGPRALTSWQFVETTAAVDEHAVFLIADAMTREMESWLF